MEGIWDEKSTSTMIWIKYGTTDAIHFPYKLANYQSVQSYGINMEAKTHTFPIQSNNLL